MATSVVRTPSITTNCKALSSDRYYGVTSLETYLVDDEPGLEPVLVEASDGTQPGWPRAKNQHSDLLATEDC